MKKSLFGIVYLLITAGMFFWCGTTAIAQESGTDSFTLEEIVVTAEKRETDLQKTSISMTVVQGDTVRNSGSTTMDDILKDIPNITTTDSGTAGGLTISIRGLGNDLPTGFGESSVSINYDGAYEARGESTLFGFFDVDRVEVLRGPQGTLYGRGASGGVLNVVSTRPNTDKVEGYASLEVAEYSKKKFEAAVNVPMADNFAGRLAVLSVKQEGTTMNGETGDRDTKSGIATRLQFRYMPSDETSLNFLCNYSEQDGQSWSEINKSDWEAGIYDVNTNDEYDQTRRNNVKNTKLSLTAEFQMGPGNVTILPTYETSKGTESVYEIARGAVEPAFSSDKQPYDYSSMTGEVRYTNREDSDIQWSTGLYYTKTKDPRNPVEPEPGRGAASTEFESAAAFAQVTYPFSDTFRGIVGARYDHTEKGYYDAENYYDALGNLSSSASGTFNLFDYKLGIEKDFSTNVMVYFTLASGHKAGGFDDDGTPFDEESNISGELGLKSRFLNNRLQVNGNVFQYLYDGYQVVDGYFDDDNNPVFNFWNADKAKSQGAEIETTALLGSATVLTLNFSYLKNEYTDDFILHPDLFGPGVNLKGETMPHSPEFSINAGIDHTFALPNGATLMPSISYRWTDEQYKGFYIIPENLGPAVSILDFRLSYIAVENWSLNFYANNALDEHYYTTVQGNGSVVFPGNPRIAGVTLDYRF